MATKKSTANPGFVLTVDTNVNYITIEDADAKLLSAGVALAFVVVTVGTFKFNGAGAADDADATTFTVGDVIPPIPFNPAVGLSYKATTIGDTFKVSFV